MMSIPFSAGVILMGLAACESWREVTLSYASGAKLSNERFLVRSVLNGIIRRQHAGDCAKLVGGSNVCQDVGCN